MTLVIRKRKGKRKSHCPFTFLPPLEEVVGKVEVKKLSNLNFSPEVKLAQRNCFQIGTFGYALIGGVGFEVAS